MANIPGGSQQRGGDTPHDDPDSGNPVKGGGRARTTLPAGVTQDDRVDQIMSLTGGALIAGIGSGGGIANIAVSPTGEVEIVGNVDTDAVETGNPVGIGSEAVQFASEPATVGADNRRVGFIATPQGIQFVLGGHPNVVAREYMTTGAQTDDAVIDSVAAGSHIVLLGIEVLNDIASTGDPKVRIGFGTATVPSEPASGASVVGVPISHPGIAGGSGVVKGYGGGIVAVGGDNEELRITCGDPTGQLQVLCSYYIATL